MLEKAVEVAENGLHCVSAEHLDVEEVYDAMKAYSDKSTQERREFISSSYVNSTLTTGYPSYHPVCTTCFCKYYNIPKSTFKRIAKHSRQGRTTA